MKIFFSVGEPSGDLHGSNLILEMRKRAPHVQCMGFGGPKMAAAGCQIHEDLTRHALMGVAPILLHIPRLFVLLSRADRFFCHRRPDAVVLIDYPGFNWWIAWRAKQHGIPVFYYGAPQLWAWAQWRVKKMRRLVDHVLCKLPFEQAWFRQHGCNATHVGHPYFDQLRSQQLDQRFLRAQRGQTGQLVTILPGSRSMEVANNLRWLLKAAAQIRGQQEDVRFAIASYNQKQADRARTVAAGAGIPVDVHVGRTQELIHLATCCMACSGSVSLELLYHAKPTVILYRIPWLTYQIIRRFLIRVRYITLVNLLSAEQPFYDKPVPCDPDAPPADEMLFPEYPTWEDKSAQLASHVIEWLRDSSRRKGLEGRLEELREKVGQAGASGRTAKYILRSIEQARRPVVPRPHFLPGLVRPRSLRRMSA